MGFKEKEPEALDLATRPARKKGLETAPTLEVGHPPAVLFSNFARHLGFTSEGTTASFPTTFLHTVLAARADDIRARHENWSPIGGPPIGEFGFMISGIVSDSSTLPKGPIRKVAQG